MTTVELLSNPDPGPILDFLRANLSDRKLRLFAVACCRLRWETLSPDWMHGAVESEERAVEVTGWEASPLVEDRRDWVAVPAREAVLGFAIPVIVGASGQVDRTGEAALLRDIAGPGHSSLLPIDPHWLTTTVISLAETIYTDRAFDRLPILADALEEAGCDDADVPNHLRGDGLHVRGCWAVDLVLGKE